LSFGRIVNVDDLPTVLEAGRATKVAEGTRTHLGRRSEEAASKDQRCSRTGARFGESTPEEELHLCVEAAKLVGHPPHQGVVYGGVEARGGEELPAARDAIG
jgi:hypothetical protein